MFDELGAGVGSRIAISEGREAAMPFHPEVKPIDAYNAAILDTLRLRHVDRERDAASAMPIRKPIRDRDDHGQPPQDQAGNLRHRRSALQEGLRRGQRRQHQLPRQRERGRLHADA